MNKRDTYPHVTILLAFLSITITAQLTCDDGWFGPDCQFKCHCLDNKCDSAGHCLEDSKCDVGWFGLGCQYQDMVTFYQTFIVTKPVLNDTSWLTDNDDMSCNVEPNLESITISWTTEYVFTWLQLAISENDEECHTTLTFRGSSLMDGLPCHSVKQHKIRDYTFEIQCNVSETIVEMTLTGQDVPIACSLHVSGGRNVALKQNTSQTTTFTVPGYSFLAENAVDGATHSNVGHNSCTQTNDETLPAWNVSFDRSYLITRYVLYSASGLTGISLSGFVLESFGEWDELVFRHADPSNINSVIDAMVNPAYRRPVRHVSITQTRASSYEGKPILQLCEVELYGDCVPGTWNLDCRECSANCYGRSCHSQTGQCYHECDGFNDTSLCSKPCSPGLWGGNCHESCQSNNCYKNSCDKHTGLCDVGCDGYSDFPECRNEGCSPETWGFNCVSTCVSANCYNNSCDTKTGLCDIGCAPGYSDFPNCTVECHPGSWGLNCDMNCKKTCLNMTCHSKTGQCTEGCSGDSGSSKCAEVQSETRDGPSILGPLALSAVFVITVVSLVIFQRQQVEEEHESEECILLDTMIGLDELSWYVRNGEKAFFENQFKSVPDPEYVSTFAGLSECNQIKNRDVNIVTYDHSRVILKQNPQCDEGDYINASYIKGNNNGNIFIASQAPDKNMVNDFVRMLWEQQTDVVVMLANLVENKMAVSEKYWPEYGVIEFGSIQVKTILEQTFADCTIRILKISKEDKFKMMTQYHFTAWPENGVPDSPWAFVDFERIVSSHRTEMPIVVHCTNGSGRTGTFIALHNLIVEAELTGFVDFYKTLTNLRDNRIAMIETAEQYLFLHLAAWVASVGIGKTLTSKNVADKIRSMDRAKMADEFKAVCSLADDLNAKENANLRPEKRHQPSVQSMTSDLTNAVFISGLWMRDQQILVNLPGPDSAFDFWRMVIQCKISLIIAFQIEDTPIDDTIAHYLPSEDGKLMICAATKILSVPISDTDLWEKKRLTIQLETRERYNLIHLRSHFTDLNPESLLNFIQHARSISVSADEKIVYTCRNGTLYSGLACVLSLLLDRLEYCACFSVPRVVGSVKSIQPDVIPTLEQYRVLYDVLNLWKA